MLTRIEFLQNADVLTKRLESAACERNIFKRKAVVSPTRIRVGFDFLQSFASVKLSHVWLSVRALLAHIKCVIYVVKQLTVRRARGEKKCVSPFAPQSPMCAPHNSCREV